MYSTHDRLPSDTQISGAYCGRDGRFGGSVAGFQVYSFGTFGSISSFDKSYVYVTGVESAGSTLFGYVGPRGALVYSPTTSLIDYAGSQAAVKHGLGLDSGLFALATDRDLTSFDPVVALASTDDATHREGARVAAANLRALTAADGLSSVMAGYYDPYFRDGPNYRAVGDYLASHNAFLFDNATMTDLLTRNVAPGRYRPDVLSAAAHLIDAYASAIGVQVSDTATAAQFTLGLPGYLRLELVVLLNANSAEAASRAMAVTNQDILNATAVYREVLPFPTTGNFFPGPDFFAASASAPLTIIADTTSGSLVSNDVYANGPTGSIGFFPSTSQVMSVSVPSANSAKVATVYLAGLVTVLPLNGFTGTTYFDYVVRHPSGEQGTGRVYVTFR